jgi:proteasome alpha subunit
MSVFGYVSPEQAQKDKADYARKNIARGRPLVGLSLAEGVLLIAENKSRNLHKLGEIYDRIAFGGVGKYNEFDQLRQSGIRVADSKGYLYSREDVDGRGLANAYGHAIGQVFTHDLKPLEVEILIAEVGFSQDDDRLFHILYDGNVFDEEGFAVLGGDADAIAERLKQSYDASASVGEALSTVVRALHPEDTPISAAELEAAILERKTNGRCFRRLSDEEEASLLAALPPAAPAPTEAAGDEESTNDSGDAS